MFTRPLPSSPPACLSQRWRVDCCPLLWWGPPCYTWAGKIPPQPGCVPIPIPVQERLIKQQHTQHAQNWHIYSLVFSSLSLSIVIPSCLLLSGRNLLALWACLRRLDSRPHPSHIPERRQLIFFLWYVSLTAYWFLRLPSTFPAKKIWIILQLLYESGFPALYLFVSRSYCGVFFSQPPLQLWNLQELNPEKLSGALYVTGSLISSEFCFFLASTEKRYVAPQAATLCTYIYLSSQTRCMTKNSQKDNQKQRKKTEQTIISNVVVPKLQFHTFELQNWTQPS